MKLKLLIFFFFLFLLLVGVIAFFYSSPTREYIISETKEFGKTLNIGSEEAELELQQTSTNNKVLSPYEIFRGWNEPRLTGNESIYFNAELDEKTGEVILTPKFLGSKVIEHCDFLDYDKEITKCRNVTYTQPNSLDIKTKTDSSLPSLTKSLGVFTYTLDPLTSLFYKFGKESIIIEGDTSFASNDSDVVQENGFAHLNLSVSDIYADLVFYMPFDTNTSQTTTYDYTENNSDGTYQADASFVTDGILGGAVAFDGTGDFIDITNPTIFAVPDGSAYTITGWFKGTTGAIDDLRILGFGNSGDSSPFVILEYNDNNNDGQLGFSHRADDNSRATLGTAIGLIDDEMWNHFAAIRHASNSFELVVNGISRDTDATSVGTTTINSFRIGDTNIGGGSRFFNGSVDEVMVFDRNLSVAEVNTIYMNQSARFKSSGTQEFRALNVSEAGDSSENRVNVTLSGYENLLGSNISVRVNGGTFINLSSAGIATNLSFTSNPNNINITFQYRPDNNSFYSPLIIGNITLDSYTEGVPPPVDNEFPKFSSSTEDPTDPANYLFGQDYQFNITLLSTNGTVGIEFDGVNFTTTNISDVYNKTFPDLAVNNYTYYYWSFGNGTAENFNVSIDFTYEVVNIIPQGSIAGTSPINFGTAGDVQGSESNDGDGDVSYVLHRDGVAVSNPDGTTLGAGSYNYLFNATKGQNYTLNSSIATFALTVNQVASVINLTLNGTQANITITKDEAIDLNCSTITGDASAFLSTYREGTLINNGTTPTTNTTTFSTLGVENVTCIYEGSQNYTVSSQEFFVTIISGADIEFPQFNNFGGTVNNTAYTSGGVYTFNVTITQTNGTAGLEFNGINRTTNNISSTYNATVIDLAAGEYTYFWWANGNGSDGNFNVSNVKSFTVANATGDITLLINGTAGNQTAPFGTQTNASASTSFGTITLFREGVDVSAENNVNISLGVGEYNYTAVSSGDANHSSATISRFVLINQISSAINLTLNNTQSNITILQGTTIDLNCSTINGDSSGNLAMTRAGNLINNGTSPIVNSTTFNTVQLENITCIYEGSQNYTVSSNSFFVDVLPNNVSLNHFEIKVEDILIASSIPVQILNATVNITSPEHTTWKGVGQINGTTGGTTQVLMTLEVGGINLFSGNVLSIKGAGDRKQFNLDINATDLGIGINNLNLFIWTDNGKEISLESYEIFVDTNVTNNGGEILHNDRLFSFSFSSTTPVNKINFTFDKTSVNSQTILDSTYRFTKLGAGAITPDCWWENNVTGEFTTHSQRYISSSSDTGSAGTYLRSQATNTTETWMLFCQADDTDTVNVNGSIYVFDSVNENGNNIGGFQNSTTNVTLISGNNNLILTNNYTQQNGTNLQLMAMVNFESTTGSQTGANSPKFFVNSSLSEQGCSDVYHRSIGGNNQPGVVKLYINCNNTVIGEGNDFNLYSSVVSGESLNILNATFISYESVELDTTTGIVPPIIVITNPTDAQNVSGVIAINGTITDLSELGWVSNITLLNTDLTSNFIILNELNRENSTSTTFNTSLVVDGDYIIQWNVTDSVGSTFDTVNITIFNADTIFPVFSAFTEDPTDPATYVTNQVYQFNTSVLDTNGTIGIEFDGVNFTASNISNIFNFTTSNLAAGTYNYYWWGFGNGTTKNFNRTIGFDYTIDKAASEVSLTLNGTASDIAITNGTSTSILLNGTLVTGDATSTLNLLRNGTLLNNATIEVSNLTLFNNTGFFNITVIYTESQNYTTNFKTFFVNVSTVAVVPINREGVIRISGRQVSSSINLGLSETEMIKEDLCRMGIRRWC